MKEKIRARMIESNEKVQATDDMYECMRETGKVLAYMDVLNMIEGKPSIDRVCLDVN